MISGLSSRIVRRLSKPLTAQTLSRSNSIIFPYQANAFRISHPNSTTVKHFTSGRSQRVAPRLLTNISRLPTIPVVDWPIDTTLPHNAVHALSQSTSIFYRYLFADKKLVSLTQLYDLILPHTLNYQLQPIAHEIIRLIITEDAAKPVFFLLQGNHLNQVELFNQIKNIITAQHSTIDAGVLATQFQVDVKRVTSNKALYELLRDRFCRQEAGAIADRVVVALDGTYRSVHLSNVDNAQHKHHDAAAKVIEFQSEEGVRSMKCLPRAKYGVTSHLPPSSSSLSFSATINKPLPGKVCMGAESLAYLPLVYLVNLPFFSSVLASSSSQTSTVASLQDRGHSGLVRGAYSVFPPSRQDYVDLFAVQWDEWVADRYTTVLGRYLMRGDDADTHDPPNTISVLDMGCGSGVLSMVMCQGFRHYVDTLSKQHADMAPSKTRMSLSVTSADVSERAVACTYSNTHSFMKHPDMTVHTVVSDLFRALKASHATPLNDMSASSSPSPPSLFSLIVFNPPWLPLPARSRTSMDCAVYDREFNTLKTFLHDCGQFLEADGYVWLVVSDLHERLGMTDKGEFERMVQAWSGLRLVSVKRGPSFYHSHTHSRRHPDTQTPHLASARAQEEIKIYVLKKV